jgi:hypothetical protein
MQIIGKDVEKQLGVCTIACQLRGEWKQGGDPFLQFEGEVVLRDHISPTGATEGELRVVPLMASQTRTSITVQGPRGIGHRLYANHDRTIVLLGDRHGALERGYWIHSNGRFNMYEAQPEQTKEQERLLEVIAWHATNVFEARYWRNNERRVLFGMPPERITNIPLQPSYLLARNEEHCGGW